MAEEQKKETLECRLCRKEKKYYGQFVPRKNEIDAWVRVCNDCVALWELGKKALSATKADGKESEAKAYINVPTDSKVGDPKGSTEVFGKDIMAALGGISLRGTAMGDEWRIREGREVIHITASQDERDHGYISGGGSLTFKVPKSRAVAMKKVVAAFYNAIAKARVDGFNEGRNLLKGLAAGSVSLDDFSDQNDNARKGDKPYKRW